MMWCEPQLGHLMQKAVEAEETMAALLKEVEIAGVLGSEPIKAIRVSAKDAWQKWGRDFDKADDIDSCF